MKRGDTLLDMLESSALMQEHISVILEAKALEAEQRRAWVCGHMRESCYPGCEEFHKNALELHENIVEVIAGITRMEQGLAKNLGILIQKEESEGTGGSSLADLFGDSGDDA